MAFVKGSHASLIYQSPLAESIKRVGNTDLFDTICLDFQQALRKLPPSRLLWSWSGMKKYLEDRKKGEELIVAFHSRKRSHVESHTALCWSLHCSTQITSDQKTALKRDEMFADDTELVRVT